MKKNENIRKYFLLSIVSTLFLFFGGKVFANNETIGSSVITESINSTKIEEPKVITVSNITELKNGLLSIKQNTTIKINGTINVDENLVLNGVNQSTFKYLVTIEGNSNSKLIFNKGFFDIKNIKNLTLKNLNIYDGNNNNNNTISLYNTTDVTIDGLTIEGSKRGLMINRSQNVSIENTVFSNHIIEAIRVVNESSLISLDTNTFKNEKIAINKQKNSNVTLGSKYLSKNGTDDSVLYYKLYDEHVSNEEQLIDSLKHYNVNIILDADITIQKKYKDNKVINQVGTIQSISGNNHTINLENDNYFYLSGEQIFLKDTTFKGYRNNQALYFINTYGYKNAEDIQQIGVTLENVTMNGQREASNNASVGIKIVGCTVVNNNYTSLGHTLASIMINSHENLARSVLTMKGSVNSENDNYVIKGIDYLSDISESNKAMLIKDETNSLYTSGPGKVYFSSKGEAIVYDYYKQNIVKVSTTDEFISAARTRSTKVVLTDSISFGSIVSADASIQGSKEGQIYVGEGTVICSENDKKVLDLKSNSLILKNKNVTILNIIIKNGGRKLEDGSLEEGVQLYNTRSINIENTEILHNIGWGIVVNGSTLSLNNVKTENNGSGGVQIVRSITLNEEHSTIDSEVKLLGNNVYNETGVYIRIINQQMLKKDASGKVIAEGGDLTTNNIVNEETDKSKYIKHEQPVKKQKLSDFYIQYFQFTGADAEKKYTRTVTDYTTNSERLDVTSQKTVFKNWTPANNGSGEYIKLDNTGNQDISDDLLTLIAYAGNYGKELYFPAGTYKLEKDINLTKVKDSIGICNVKISGDISGLSVIKGVDGFGSKMITSMGTTEDYQYGISYMTVSNMAFDNVSFALKGPNKLGNTFENNLFFNGAPKLIEYNGSQQIKLDPYIDIENSFYTVKNNVMLRDKSHPGKGIYTFATIETEISGNLIGNVDKLNSNETIDPQKMLPPDTIALANRALSSGIISANQENGNFFTGINLVRRDEGTVIQGNYLRMEETKDISSTYSNNIPIYSLNDSSAPQRRDHLIYAKGYENISIVGNYFSGMENGGAGGLKIRNGDGAYIGANYFDSVPLLSYVYPDLSWEEMKLNNTIIYNNLFSSSSPSSVPEQPNPTDYYGSPHVGLLFYPSFVEGQQYTLAKSQTDSEKETRVAKLEVKNFVMNNNKFSTDNRDGITINKNAKSQLSGFYIGDNVYAHNAPEHGLNNLMNTQLIFETKNSSLVIPEKSSHDIQKVLNINPSYVKYKDMDIPLKEKTRYKYYDYNLENLRQSLNVEKANLGIFNSAIYDNYLEKLSNYVYMRDKNNLSQADINLFQTDITNEVLEHKNLMEFENNPSTYVTVPSGITLNDYEGKVLEGTTDKSNDYAGSKVSIELSQADSSAYESYGWRISTKEQFELVNQNNNAEKYIVKPYSSTGNLLENKIDNRIIVGELSSNKKYSSFWLNTKKNNGLSKGVYKGNITFYFEVMNKQ